MKQRTAWNRILSLLCVFVLLFISLPVNAQEDALISGEAQDDPAVIEDASAQQEEQQNGAAGENAVFGVMYLQNQKKQTEFYFETTGTYAHVSVTGTYKKKEPSVRALSIPEADGKTVLEAWTVDGMNGNTELSMAVDIAAMPALEWNERISVYSVRNDRLGDILLADASAEDKADLKLSHNQDTGIALVKESTGEGLVPGNAIWANDDLYITGKIPGNAVVSAVPVKVDIDGRQALTAYEISIYANASQMEKGKTWKPADEKVQVHFRNPKFENAKGPLTVYHLKDEKAAAEKVAEVKADENGWIVFDADSFSIYAVAGVIERDIRVDGETWHIAVSYDSDSGIPSEGVELLVKEIKEGDDAYDGYLSASAERLGIKKESIGVSRAFDLKIVDAKDHDRIYEPKTEVDVEITLVGVDLDEYANVGVLHFAEGRRSKSLMAVGLENQASGDTVRFSTDSFSVYVVVAHEGGDVIAPRVEFHFISDYPGNPQADSSNSTVYYASDPYSFKNRNNDTQTTQILKDGEALELITDPVNQNDSYFYGWYVVEPHVISGTTDDYGIGTADQKLYYTWPATPDRITFESPISITATGVSIGSTVSWSLNGVSASGSVDANGDVHVFLAPLFERYHFVNFMLRPRNTTGSNNLMTRKLIAMGSADSVEVKISDIRSNSTDPVHLVFTGWEYYDAASGQWITKQTVDYDGSALADSGKDGVYFSVSLTGSESVDLYPVFIEARWVDFFAGVSGSGAAYVASRFLESWGRATATNPPADTPDKNVFTNLEVSTRTGYAFDGWYAFAKTNSTTGEITNLTGSEAVEITYLTLDGEGDYVPHTVTVTTTAVKIANADGTINNSNYWSITDNGDGTGTLNNNDSGHKLLQTADGKLRFFDPLDRLTLSAKWA
ncbi:MAG: hypothetical protein K5919_00350, partial [Clostridiales bacterium]|nr:hypothetical protein [Clostridiales bacterium]